ncbi:mitochondrial putative cytochrome c peroxidase [Amylocarpus encephaloides]|uniref:Peroxidase n=1 Tax=Amylocarpus encephaloides TaxID=45428 RepID=A0A9P7YME6_9HELO|nr:mitochondrial putative cytochrome c peroxidase [Amylocarpus encephaloides]
MASNATRTFARAALKSTPSLRASARNTAFVLPRQTFRQQSRRGYSSEPTKSSSSGLYLGIGAAAIAGGAGYYLYSNGSLFSGSSGETKGIFTPKFEDYQKIYNEIAARLEEKDDYDDGSYGPVLVRLAWHASGTFDKETGTGGSNGATMRFAPEGDHGANAGLVAARDFLEPVKAKYPWITYSDLWILAGVCAIQEMQGPTIPYRPGRSDKDVAACTPDGRLPDASQGNKHLRNIFYRMGFNDQEIVALSGAHALGRCHSTRSGFEGPWTFSPTVVTNEYYKLLLNEKWNWKKWNGPKQLEDKTTKTLMMLPTDMAIVSDKAFKEWAVKYAKDEELFFKDFSNVIVKLFELGVPFAENTEQSKMIFKPTS